MFFNAAARAISGRSVTASAVLFPTSGIVERGEFMNRLLLVLLVVLAVVVSSANSQTAENVAVVINDASPESKEIGEYYVQARGIPAANVIRIKTATTDVVDAAVFDGTIQQPIGTALFKA